MASPMRTVVVTGSAGGIGAATRQRLETAGQRVVGVDLADADVVADLSSPARARRSAVEEVAALTGGVVDGVVAAAGIRLNVVVPGPIDTPMAGAHGDSMLSMGDDWPVGRG